MIKKGTSYTISGDSVTIDSEGEEYWEYGYDLLDRLISVKKNGTPVTNYTYNYKGLRLKKENYDTTIYYVFGINDNVLYEQENGNYNEYIYVGGQHFARLDGELLSTETTTYFYHTDYLGSTVLITNASADIVWSSEYTPFGSLTMEEGEYGFQKAKKFTGKDLDEDTGLYYYNARWYDAEIGRFTSADTYKGELVDPKTLNLYIYTANNPLIYVDPTGHMAENLFIKTISSFREIGISLWVGAKHRSEHAFDSPYGFANYMTIGTLEGLVSGAQNRASRMINSPYDFINYSTLGSPDLLKATFNPDDPLSAEHWLASLRTAAITTVGINYANNSGLTTKVNNKVSNMMTY